MKTRSSKVNEVDKHPCPCLRIRDSGVHVSHPLALLDKLLVIPDLVLGVSVFGFRVLIFGFQVSGFEFSEGSEFKIKDLGVSVYLLNDFRDSKPGTRNPKPETNSL
jgi:hypothetical protein